MIRAWAQVIKRDKEKGIHVREMIGLKQVWIAECLKNSENSHPLYKSLPLPLDAGLTIRAPPIPQAPLLASTVAFQQLLICTASHIFFSYSSKGHFLCGFSQSSSHGWGILGPVLQPPSTSRSVWNDSSPHLCVFSRGQDTGAEASRHCYILTKPLT